MVILTHFFTFSSSVNSSGFVFFFYTSYIFFSVCPFSDFLLLPLLLLLFLSIFFLFLLRFQFFFSFDLNVKFVSVHFSFVFFLFFTDAVLLSKFFFLFLSFLLFFSFLLTSCWIRIICTPLPSPPLWTLNSTKFDILHLMIRFILFSLLLILSSLSQIPFPLINLFFLHSFLLQFFLSDHTAFFSFFFVYLYLRPISLHFPLLLLRRILFFLSPHFRSLHFLLTVETFQQCLYRSVFSCTAWHSIECCTVGQYFFRPILPRSSALLRLCLPNSLGPLTMSPICQASTSEHIPQHSYLMCCCGNG